MDDTKAIQQAIGERIRLARVQARLTQEELAERLGRNQQSISQLENGERNLPATDMLALSRELRVSILYFYEDMLDEQEVNETADLREALLQQFTRLPTMASKRAAIQLLQTLGDAILRPE